MTSTKIKNILKFAIKPLGHNRKLVSSIRLLDSIYLLALLLLLDIALHYRSIDLHLNSFVLGFLISMCGIVLFGAIYSYTVQLIASHFGGDMQFKVQFKMTLVAFSLGILGQIAIFSVTPAEYIYLAMLVTFAYLNTLMIGAVSAANNTDLGKSFVYSAFTPIVIGMFLVIMFVVYYVIQNLMG